MSQENNANKKTSAESFADMFKAFGRAISEIFSDPELKQKAKEFAESAAKSAGAFGGMFKDEDVKDKFRDVRRAAEDFGKSIADQFKKGEYKFQALRAASLSTIIAKLYMPRGLLI